jgi:hypothetical protein
VAVFEPKFKKLRAMKMVEGKVMHNMTNTELAKEFNCSVDTVERTLSWAKKADIFASYEDKIVQELIPLAHTAIRDALADGNAKIAVEVFKGLNLLKSGPAPVGSAQRNQEDDLASYIAAKRDRAQLQENTIEGKLIEGGHDETAGSRLLAEATSRKFEEGLSPTVSPDEASCSQTRSSQLVEATETVASSQEA